MTAKEIGKTYMAGEFDTDDVVQEGTKVGNVQRTGNKIWITWYPPNVEHFTSEINANESFVYRGQRQRSSDYIREDFYDPACKAITVGAARKLLHKFGMDQLCIIAWDDESEQYNVVTAGSNRINADMALEFSRRLAERAGIKPGGHLFEDRRHEHAS
jgi:hypothetical protein